jgi:Tfp pilus assembly ATPase PilU
MDVSSHPESKKGLAWFAYNRNEVSSQEHSMQAPIWDRLLETCSHNDASDLLLVPGSPPLIRLKEEWRVLSLPPLEMDQIRSMVEERMSGCSVAAKDGSIWWDIQHSDGSIFRISAFGYPETKVLLMARLPSKGSEVKRVSVRLT